MATSSSSAIGKLSKEEWRRKQDLDAARKAGTAPAEVDEEGKSINPHIPQFMAQAPWYMDTGRPSLKHQKAPEYNDDISKLQDRYQRGKFGKQATKYRKGACENCGALTHQLKDCVERPRKRGAKFTNSDIAPDEIIHDNSKGLNFQPGRGDWDAKRDRWDGYNPGSEYKKTVEEYEKLDEERRKLREEEIDKGAVMEGEGGLSKIKKVAKKSGGTKKSKKKKSSKSDSEDSFGTASSGEESNAEEVEAEGEVDDDDLKYADKADAAGQRMDTKTRITVRNLRIREDTAKYLMNLDLESAYYDPKSRSMRDAPKQTDKPEDANFAGENFLRNSGAATEVQQLQLFAWQSEQRGHDVHMNALPTQAQLLHNKFKEKKEEAKETNKKSILDKYGGEKYLEKVPKELLMGQSEDYVEFDNRGKVIKGRERVKPKSKYDEDVYVNNHTAVWGSWYNLTTGQWGYACCHQNIKNSYCVGKALIEAKEKEANGMLFTGTKKVEEDDKGKGKERESDEKRKKRRRQEVSEDSDDSSSSDESSDDESEEEARKKKLGKVTRDEPKRSKGGVDGKVTEEEMEAYRMNRNHWEDPMANYQD